MSTDKTMKQELLVNVQNPEIEEDEEAGAPEEGQVRSRLGRGNSLLCEEEEGSGAREPSYLPADFPPRPLSGSFRVLLPANAIVMGLLPAVVVALVPVPKGFEEQGVFWKDRIVVLFIAVLGLLFSILTTLVRVPAFYRISRTRLTVVSVARTKWWYSPCYTACAPAYSVNIQDIQAAELRDAPLLSPPLIVAPPRTTSSRQMCMIVVKSSFPHSLLAANYQLWITPQDPRELMNVLGRVLHERDTRPPPSPKRAIKTKAPLAPRSPSSPHKPRATPHGSQAVAAETAVGAAGEIAGRSSPIVLGADWKSIHRDVELIKYKLEGSETLEGLALKFDCKVEDIKRINGMAASSLAAFSTLMLPVRPAAVPT